MKKLNTESKATGMAMAAIHDYQSGVLIGTASANWTQYRAWADGPSDVCAAKRCLSADVLASLNLDGDATIYLLEA